MTNARRVIAFMGANIVAATMFTSMFMDVSGFCLSIGIAVILSQASFGDYS